MAPGHGKSSRPSKRGPSSSSSNLSTAMMVVFVGFCLFGVYMLTSSSLTQLHAAPAIHHHHHHKRTAIPVPRNVLRDPPPAHEDTQPDLPEDAIKGDAAAQEDGRGESGASWQHEKQQQDEEVETHRVIKESLDQAREQQHIDDNQSLSEDQQQNEEQQQQQQNNDEEQQQQQLGEAQSNDEPRQQQQQMQSKTNGEESHQEETTNNESQQQQSQTETDKSHHRNQQDIQQVTDRSQSQSEDGGITSESQIEHDTDGTTEHHQEQQQQQEDGQETQQQQEQQEEEQQQQQQQEEHEQETQQQQEQQEETELQQQQEEEEEQKQQQQQQREQQQQQESSYESATRGSNENNQQSEDKPNEKSDPLPEDTESVMPNENKSDHKTWATQADQSSNEKERRKGEGSSQSNDEGEGRGNGSESDGDKLPDSDWELCNVTAGPDYIPCLDNEKAIKKLRSFSHFEHRERHCPEESPTCLVPLPKGYKRPIEWPQSRYRIWYNNVPRTKLAEVKGHQNWVKVTGEYLTFPGGGTQFIHGALHYIDFIQEAVPDIAWGKHTRVILDVGCGVASFGGFLFERDVLAMSFAPKDEHEAQVQFALERGIPAISAVMGSQRLPFPSKVFDIVHCARCRVPWHANDGALLLELNRILRPGGFFVWSATPVYQKLKEDVEIWDAMTALTKSMCWELVTIKKDKLNSIGAAMFRKPVSNECYEKRTDPKPPMCKEDDDPNAAWYVPLQSCMHRVPVDPSERGSQWPQEWPNRVQVPPYWLNNTQVGVYGNPAPEDFRKDYEHWKRVVRKSYLNRLGIDWSHVRNVMDMRAVYGGFAAALKDMKVWVMNLVNVDSPDTLPVIYERGLFGMYHDWCESFSTYPRTYDLLHSDRLFSQLKKRCRILPVIAEVDRIVRPGGNIIVRDESAVVSEIESILKSMHWEVRLSYSKNRVGILCAEKSDWRPENVSTSSLERKIIA